MNARMWKSAVVSLVAGIGLITGMGATAHGATAPSEQDKAFMASNAQTSLAEITLAGITLDRSSNTQSRDLATMTMADHKAALAKLQAVADKVGVTLPTAPNPDQQATAAKLKSVPASEYDLDLANAEIMGHQMSLSATNIELNTGSDADLLAYTKYYLPVVTKHLTMAQSLLASLGGTPTGVPAGTGGQGATTSSGTVAEQFALAGAGVLLVGGGALLLLRRRRSTS